MAVLPTINITVTVPPGTSTHGEPNLLCTPTKWFDVFLFFAVNYFSHAITVKSAPGEQTLDSFLDILSALFHPFSGVPRGIEAIFRRAAFFSSDDLQKAARAGALCIVVRDHVWRPRVGDVLKGLELQQPTAPKQPRNETAQYNLTTSPLLEEGNNDWRMYPNRDVHGIYVLPDGYTLARLPSNARIKLSDTKHHAKIKLSSSYNMPKVIVSIVQVLYASSTLYRSRGDQIARYGYAAFGLTVIPYIIMSIINLLGHLLTPDYSTLYLIRSSEMVEAEAEGRAGYFAATIGSVVEDIPESFQNAGAGSYIVEKVSQGQIPVYLPPEFTLRKHVPTITPSKITSSNTGSSLDPPKDATEASEILAGPKALQNSESSALLNVVEFGHGPDKDKITIRIPCCTPFQTEGPQLFSRRKAKVMYYVTVFFLGAIPYAVIALLTGFRPGSSTKAQRVWTMGWLSLGCVWGALFPRNMGSGLDQRSFEFGFSICFCAFAVGGFVVVGQMLEAYGSCTLF